MIEPTVCAVMLTQDRPEYARRAVECFRAQTYDLSRLRLRVHDNGDDRSDHSEIWGSGPGVVYKPVSPKNIGALRNEAVASASGADIIIHWDDDDWSHPNRIAEQVSLLQSSGKDCVGYRELLFWDRSSNWIPNPAKPSEVMEIQYTGEAWLYSDGDIRTCVGTSLCYWREVWEQHPFSEKNGANPRERGEDREFVRQVKSLGDSGFGLADGGWDEYTPRLIARIHAGNAHHYTVRNAPWWRRAPEWDKHCAEVMG